MKRIIIAALGFAALASAASPAFAFNEVFEVRMKGWEYCGNYSYRKLTKQSSKPLYAYFANDRELVISESPDFYDWQKFTLSGESYITGKKSASFVGVRRSRMGLISPPRSRCLSRVLFKSGSSRATSSPRGPRS